MRFWIKLFWVLVFGTFAAFFYLCIHTLKERESLLVLDSSEELLDYTSGPGYVFEWKTILPWKYTVVRFPIFSKISNVVLNIDLSSGMFPENSPEGKIRISLEVRYSLHPNKAFEFLEAAGIGQEKIDSYIKKIVYSIIRKKVEEFLANPNTLKINLDNYLKTNFSSELLSEEKTFQNLNLRILDLQVPEPALITGVYRNQNLILQKKLDLATALGKAEAHKIEEDAKISSLLRRLEKTKDFITKNPDMKEFLLYESLSDNIEVILLPSEMILGEVPSSKKKKNSKKPKEVE
ncbi:hypothetical protein [Leptospira kirschneri]|uniref:Uncharacterized protein n=1 Tax=Leptospira kirschneri str. 200802841 TaxID=1193047 RepID=A0A828Y975_9LEPT|nr:hypothetical protein [Leptospira kirschneri]EJO69514.1 hypothetical protein LEP1GSC044_2744 [Leptospira kirschneri serovar Grippotyphosa str. RM52]EKO53295.1 hypothetical protein LEP1GSC131_0588 [Leptospira kirschneri str. 200802841]EKQ82514.1 hypothetical protein LEP1GSC064_2134 [Leptospira kirschneri serovar Grippotyphosa str. Moskva]EKR07517.1 hypothetical protein LEP1GSC122_2762 [Leptospira kirschneri serovar Valbuzzi str. 200702274]EMK07308.1 hypothetical protein LEP1GSC176_3639 [Lepto